MKVFNFSGRLVYIYNDKIEFHGSFLLEDDGQIEGYIKQKTAKNLYTRAIKGLYNEEKAQLLFVIMTEGWFSPEMLIFLDTTSDGWVSSYHRDYKTFSVYAGVRWGTAKLSMLEQVTNEEAQKVRETFENLAKDSSSISKEMTDDIRKHEWLFSFVEHLSKSAL